MNTAHRFRLARQGVCALLVCLVSVGGLACGGAQKTQAGSAAGYHEDGRSRSKSTTTHQGEVVQSAVRVQVRLGSCSARIEEAIGGNSIMDQAGRAALTERLSEGVRHCFSTSTAVPGTAFMQVKLRRNGEPAEVLVAPGGAMSTERGTCLQSWLRASRWAAQQTDGNVFLAMLVVSCHPAVVAD